MPRGTERDSVSACHFHVGHVRAPVEDDNDQEWALTDNEDNPNCLPCTHLDTKNWIRLVTRYNGRSERTMTEFHPDLCLPSACSKERGMTVLLEGQARECITVALSPDDSYQLGTTYTIQFGCDGNTTTTIRRRLPKEPEVLEVTIPGRVCSEQSWISYWIVLTSSGKLYVGVGTQPGTQCIGCLDDSLYHNLRPLSDAVRFVGLGNSTSPRQQTRAPLKLRHVRVTTVPKALEERLHSLKEFPMISVLQDDAAMMETYKEECAKAKARAEKFGIPYKEPSTQAFLPYSHARKLTANPERGFITGLDTTAPEERAKQEARKARFGMATQEEENQATTAESSTQPPPSLPAVQAWDNEELVQRFRKDPPLSLWTHPPPPEDESEEKTDFAMETEEPTAMPHKIHLFAIDWAAFKQIRTNDIMAHFSVYGPSYIEWLGDLSCNVLFEDQYSAKRALEQLTEELPTPPPEEIKGKTDDYKPPDFGRMGWRLGKRTVRKIANDKAGRRGTTARVLMRVATSLDVLLERPTSWPKPPPGFSTKRVLGPGSDFPVRKKRQRPVKAYDPNSGEDHPLMSRGLSSGRGGFSVEEMEAERARKKQKAVEKDDDLDKTATDPEEGATEATWKEDDAVEEATEDEKAVEDPVNDDP